jgi:hypothetical protein
MNKHQSLNTSLLPFPVIRMAADGNVDAINAVLKHYEGYIAALSTRRLYDENGNPHLYVDEELKRRLKPNSLRKSLLSR